MRLRSTLALVLVASMAACQLWLDLSETAEVPGTDGDSGAATEDAASSEDASLDAADAGDAADPGAYRAAVLADRPYAYWTFDDATGPIEDLVGKRVLVQEGLFRRGVPGVSGFAVQFTNTNAALRFPDPGKPDGGASTRLCGAVHHRDVAPSDPRDEHREHVPPASA